MHVACLATVCTDSLCFYEEVFPAQGSCQRACFFCLMSIHQQWKKTRSMGVDDAGIDNMSNNREDSRGYA